MATWMVARKRAGWLVGSLARRTARRLPSLGEAAMRVLGRGMNGYLGAGEDGVECNGGLPGSRNCHAICRPVSNLPGPAE